MVAADFIVGILGNILSIVSYASTIGTFKEIVDKRSSENYDGLPYITSLLSSALWTLYGILDPDDGILIITVNAIGLVSQIIYLAIYLFYASKEKKVKYFGLIVLDVVFFGAVVAVTLAAFHGGSRRTFIGIICAAFTIIMYAAPLAATKTVITTKSVVYMPFFLSFSLLLNAIVWFAFGVLLMDYYVMVPNGVGVVLGALQVAVYMIYRNSPESKTMEMVEKEQGMEKESREPIDDDDDTLDVEKGKQVNYTQNPPPISRQCTVRENR